MITQATVQYIISTVFCETLNFDAIQNIITCRQRTVFSLNVNARINNYYFLRSGTAVAQWLRCCATNRKVAGSIPASVSGFLIDIKSFRSLCDPRVDSASNRNEYQEYFLGVKAAGA